MGLIFPALLLLLTVPLVVALMRANELFVVRARDGEVALVRGRIPARLLGDIADVAGRAGLDDLELRCLIEDGRPKLYAGDAEVSREARQQLRNVIGQWQVSQIRSAPKLSGSAATVPLGPAGPTK